MQEFSRVFGFQLLAAGILMLAFPEAARRFMRVREEFAHLSPGALRLLGGLELVSGSLLVWLTARPTAEVGAGTFTLPEHRRAA